MLLSMFLSDIRESKRLGNEAKDSKPAPITLALRVLL